MTHHSHDPFHPLAQQHAVREPAPGRGFINAITGERFDDLLSARKSASGTLRAIIGNDDGNYSLESLKALYADSQRERQERAKAVQEQQAANEG